MLNLDTHWDSKSKSFTDVAKSGSKVVHIVHKGYVSLLPLALGIIPRDSKKLKDLLELIRSPEELWSPYGICSLSKSDEMHGTGENYWRGPVL